MQHRTLTALGLAAALALVGAACGGDDDDDAASTTTAGDATETTAADDASADGALEGTFAVTATDCAAGAPTAGSYFRMVQSGGTVADGPYIDNGDSTCGDKTYTPLAPGSDGGLTTGAYQPQADPPFDAGNNGTAAGIVEPVKFFAVNFGVSTNEQDPASSTDVPAPSIENAAGTLSGDLSAVSVAWNGQQFNQGAPKPDGSLPGNTAAVTGTYDEATGAYTLDWASQISGGPFDGFTGVWHLEGTFTAGG